MLARAGKGSGEDRRARVESAEADLRAVESKYNAAKAAQADAISRLEIELVFKKPRVGFPRELEFRPSTSVEVSLSEFLVRNAFTYLLERAPTEEEYTTGVSLLESLYLSEPGRHLEILKSCGNLEILRKS